MGVGENGTDDCERQFRNAVPSTVHARLSNTSENAMKAWKLERLGGALSLEEVPVPDVRPGSVLVRIQASPLLSYLKQYVEGRLNRIIHARVDTCGHVAFRLTGVVALRLLPFADQWMTCTISCRRCAVTPPSHGIQKWNPNKLAHEDPSGQQPSPSLQQWAPSGQHVGGQQWGPQH